MKTIIKLVIAKLGLLSLANFAFPPLAQAVSPAPDGGYPGGNTAEGQAALLSLTTGGFNTAVGFFSLRGDATGQLNTAVGAGALLANTADSNTATGAGALLNNTTGSFNTANGAFALFNNTTGGDNLFANTATGSQALFSNTTGRANTAVGYRALVSNTTGDANIAVGVDVLQNNISGSGNIAVGYLAGQNITTANDTIAIGDAGQNIDQATFIGHIIGTPIANGVPVVIDTSTGQLGEVSSSERFKTAIKPMGRTSEAILALKPVIFQYKSDQAARPQFGLIAEDVEKVDPDLVARDKEDKPYTVRYDKVNAMLLNEFLKEHKRVQELEAIVAQQQRGIQALAAHIKEQDSRIQTMSAQIGLGKPALRLVASEP
jgi:trimeric autotransporter adhesin